MTPQERETELAMHDAFAFVYQETAKYWKRLGFLQRGSANFVSPIHNLEITLWDETAPRLHVTVRLDYSIYPAKATGNEALVEQYEAYLESWAKEKGCEVLPARAHSSHPADSMRTDMGLEYWILPLLH